jgi:hypothetical protein
VLVLHDGRIVRTLQGADLTERNLVASALNLPAATAGRVSPALAAGMAS